MHNEAYLALGSNMGDRLTYIRQALLMMDNHPAIRLVALSSVYETKPVGFVEQADFLNMVALIDTSLAPQALLSEVLNIERTLHRKRDRKWGPRTIDIDILLFGRETIQSEQLTIPHARMTERAFVLTPLCEIAPDVTVPGTGQTVAALLEHVSGKEGVLRCPRISLAAEFGLTAN